MPVYLFTFRAYGTWLPDRKQGYVKHVKKILPPDPVEAEKYRERMKHETVPFPRRLQKLLIEEALLNATHADYRVNAIACEINHLHVLCSWKDWKAWIEVRTSLKQSLSRRLNKEFEKRQWFAQRGSRKRVENQRHFDYLVNKYLPSHSGLQWNERELRERE